MYCPRCGHQNDSDSRFCSNCGANLPREGEPAKEKRSWRQRAKSVIGTTRAARLVTVGIVVAVIVGVIAFLSLDTGEEFPRDDYAVQADELCVAAKQQIAAEGNRSLAAGVTGPTGYAASTVPILAAWRLNLFNLEVPGDRVDEATDLNDALIQLLIQMGALARVPADATPDAVTAQAGRVDAASKDVEDAVAGLDLDDCKGLQITAAPASG